MVLTERHFCVSRVYTSAFTGKSSGIKLKEENHQARGPDGGALGCGPREGGSNPPGLIHQSAEKAMEIKLVTDATPPGQPHIALYDDGSNLTRIRNLPARRWDGFNRRWLLPYVLETYTALRNAGFPVAHLAAPEQSGYRIERPHGKLHLLVRTLGTPDDVQRCKKIPERRSWSVQDGAWICSPTKSNVQYLYKAFPQAIWEGSAHQLIQTYGDSKTNWIKGHAARKKYEADKKIRPPDDYKFYTKPYEHQVIAFTRMREFDAFGLFMEMGTGKGKVYVDDTAYHHIKGRINASLVLCPNNMKEPWAEEFEKHCPEDIPLDIFVWEARTRHKAEGWILQSSPNERPLRVLIMNIEALSGDVGHKIAELFVSRHACSIAVDESSRIKSAGASRTKRAIALGKRAKYRRILTGTPITQGPLDLFTQFKFLDPRILGFSSYYTFRNRYAIMGGFQNKNVIGYCNLEELQSVVDTRAYRVLKTDCLDLPPKVYEKRTVELTPQQRKIYDDIREEMKTELDSGVKISIMHQIVKIMRLQQVVGGFIPIEHDGDEDDIYQKYKPLAIDGGNPKLEALVDILEDIPEKQKVIIWARFRPELDLITQTLREKYGAESTVEMRGGLTEAIKQEGRRRFQDKASGAKFLVGQPASGGFGLTLTAASLMIYFSNDYSLETRLQSEDRFHRIGQEADKVTIIDLIARACPTESQIYAALRGKKNLADVITGDPKLSWL